MRQIPRLNEGRRRNLLAFHLNYEPAMSFEEIAAVLGCTKQLVWFLYVQALEKIRCELRKDPKKHRALLAHTELGRGAAYPDWGRE